MKLTCDRVQLLESMSAVASVAPARTPKPVLQNVKLTISQDGNASLLATDHEVSIHRRLGGVQTDEFGSVLLPAQRTLSILKSISIDTVDVEVDNDKVTVTAGRSKFTMTTEPVDLFPEVEDFNAESYSVVSQSALRRLIRRTIFAADPESMRYALGGSLIVPGEGRLQFVATDGRRLAIAEEDATHVGDVLQSGIQAVLPVKALKLIDRNLEPDGEPVHMAATASLASVQAGNVTITTRLVEGRYPSYERVIPDHSPTTATVTASTLLAAVEQATLATSEETRGVDFAFDRDGLLASLNLTSRSEASTADVTISVELDGEPVTASMDPRYIAEAIKTMGDTEPVAVRLIDSKSVVVFVVDGFQYVVMPMTRDS